MTEEQKPEGEAPEASTEEKTLAEGVLDAVDGAMGKVVDAANTAESKFGEGLGKAAEMASAAAAGVAGVTGVTIEVGVGEPDEEGQHVEVAPDEAEAAEQAEDPVEEEVAAEADDEVTEEVWDDTEDPVERDFLKKMYELSDDALSEVFQRLEPGKLLQTFKGLSLETRRRVRDRMPEEMRETLDDTLAHIEPVGEIAKTHSQALLKDLMGLWVVVDEEGELDEELVDEGEELTLGQLNAADTLEWLLALAAAYETNGKAVVQEALAEADDPMLNEGLSMLAEEWPVDRMKLILERRKKAELIEAERRLEIIEAALGMMREGASSSEIRKVCEAFLPYDA